MTATLQGISLKDRLMSEYELQRTALLLNNPLLERFRESAAKSFSEKGFPARKEEEYRYLNFSQILHSELSAPFALNAPENAKNNIDFSLINADAPLVVLTNGFFNAELSNLNNLPEGVTIMSLASAVKQNDKHALSVLGTLAKPAKDSFIALNSALFMDGVFIYIPKGKVLESPIQLIQQVDSDEAVFPQTRILLIAERQAEARVLYHVQAAKNHTSVVSNTVIELDLEEGAQVEWVSVQEEGKLNGHISTTESHVRKHANLRHISIALSGALVRNNLNIVLDEEHCESHLYGYYHPSQDEVIDNHTLVEHRKANCESNELYKGVVDGNGTAVFNGKVFVEKDAQKTNAFQSNKNILLSEGGSVNTKPQLEIYADDVKCSHGSSTGILDPDQVFYLRSRGLSLEKARALLLHAYAGEVLEQIHDETLREKLALRIEQLISN
jgi:Fe-S cluster assembly protein SufD